MGKKIFLLILLFFLPASLLSQIRHIESFEGTANDTPFWQLRFSPNAADSLGFVVLRNDSALFFEGSASLQMDWGIDNCEIWGRLSRIEHWLPGDSLLDFAFYDTLSLWYYIDRPASAPGAVELRLLLFDVSDSENGNLSDCSDSVEVFYSFHYILDQAPGWQRLLIPLEQSMSIGGQGFNLTQWSGIPGNEVLDLDKIKGYAFEFAISSGSDSSSSNGSMHVDAMSVFTTRDRHDFIFNGVTYPPNVKASYIGQDGGIEISEEDSYSASKSIKWTTSANELYSGPVFTFEQPLDYSLHWQKTPLSFKMRMGEARGDIKIIISDDDKDGDGPDQSFYAEDVIESMWMNYNGFWDAFRMPLQNFDRFAGAAPMDSSRLWQVRFLITDSASLGQTIYLDDILLGEPFDSGRPEQPIFTAFPDDGAYCNVISWEDLSEETNESYTIYFSEALITPQNFYSDDVEVAATGISGEVQFFRHRLIAPLNDSELNYYYAVTCVDSEGSESLPVDDCLVANRGRGWAVISYLAAFPFSADGDLSEWTGQKPFIMKPSDGSGTVVDGTVIDGDADLSARMWLACDAEALYVAFEIDDDTLICGMPERDLWDNDSPELFIGLYDAHNMPHEEQQEGREPDYQFNLGTAGVFHHMSGHFVVDSSSADYRFTATGNGQYRVEARLPFERIAALRPDSLFMPQPGQRIPLDVSINDIDSGTRREGILTLSPDNQDMSWRDVSRWSHSWVWDEANALHEPLNMPPSEFELLPNYPNPFNPETTLRFTVPPGKKRAVHIAVYNIRGQQIAVLADGLFEPGPHRIQWHGSDHNGQPLPAGVYFYLLKSGATRLAGKMVLLR